MYLTTNALVLRQVAYKEADRILTLLTSTDGKITVKARGAMRKGSKMAAATQQLTYSEMTLFGNRDKWSVNEANIIEPFTGLQKDIESLALACYFAECLEALSVENLPDEQLLQLGLNSLFALSNNIYSRNIIKAGFEFRLMCLSGYAPQLDCCAVCGEKNMEEPRFSIDRGIICCSKCINAQTGSTIPLNEDSLSALRYISAAPAKKIFSFKLNEPSRKLLNRASESYLLKQTERKYSTLEYYKKIRSDI